MEVLAGIVAAVGLVYLLWRLFVWNTRRRMINAFRSVLIVFDERLPEIRREVQRTDPSEARKTVLFLEREICAGLAHLARKISIVTRAPRDAADWTFIAIRLEEKGIAGMPEAAPVLQSLGQFRAAALVVSVADGLAGLLADAETQPVAGEGFPDFDLYEQIEVSPNASSDVIRVAYRRLARRHHPDSSSDPDAARWVKINIAFETLSSAELRRAYDMWRADPQRTDQSGGDPTRSRQSPRSDARRQQHGAPRAVRSERPSGVSPSVLVVLAIVVVVGGAVVIGALQSEQGDTSSSSGTGGTTRPASVVPNRRPAVPASATPTTSVAAPVTAAAFATPPAPVSEAPVATPTASVAATATAPVSEAPVATPTPSVAATATAPVSEAPVATPTPSVAATATAPVSEAPVATPTPSVAATATAPVSETPRPTQPSVRTSFGDGTYLVPDEVVPGIYVTSDAGSLCRVYDHRSRRVAGGAGTVTITVSADWSRIEVSNCGTFRPHTPSVRTSFGDGTYLVPDEVAPGTYVTSDAGSLCRVYDHRSRRVAGGAGIVTITVSADWSRIKVSNCGTFRPHTPSVRTSFGDGTYLVPDEVVPGIYVTSDAGSLCRVYDHRSRRVAGGAGTVTITVSADWSRIKVSNCGTFRPHTPSVRTSFGDGTYLVPDEVVPGIYVTSDADSLCRVYDHRSRRVAGGAGIVTITVSADWSRIKVSNCGTFRPHTPSVRTSFGDGTYLVPDEVAPGTYVTSDAGSLCRVYDHRSRRVAGGAGIVTITVSADWSRIKVSNCGTFSRQSAPS